MAFSDRKIAADIGAWFGNVSSSVLIIFINKVLMSKKGYHFHYATTLCALHYLFCSLSIWATQGLGYAKKEKLALREVFQYVATANLSIVTLNLSLMINPVGFYQIAKLMIIPFVCMVEKFWLGRKFTQPVVISVCVVVVGVAVVTVSDGTLESNPLGVTVAALSVVSSGMQQILCRTMQQKHKLSSHELLSNTAPVQGWTLLLLGPFLDRFVTDDWVFSYDYSVPALSFLLVSCSFAVLVNISQFACLGRFSAVSFQVLGHSKTILVLLGGWLFMGDIITQKQLAGMILAVSGMVGYGWASSNAPAAPASKKSAEKEGLLSERESIAINVNSFRPGLTATPPKKQTADDV